MIFQRYVKPYDLPTAAFFTLAVAFLARRQLGAYLLVFLLSSFNRETTILLLPVFLVYGWSRIDAVRYWMTAIAQVVTFVTVQAAIRYHFRNAPGSSVWISPVENMTAHWNHPAASLIGLAVAILVLWLVFRQWQAKPVVLRTAFVILAPVLFLLYFIAGQAFEYRVFAELYSTAALLALPSVIRVMG
jgi:hypothetical protein